MSAIDGKPPGAPSTSPRACGADEPALPGDRFTEVTPIGRGSMGVVYRVHDASRRQTVAVKTLPGLDPDQVYWLKNEFRLLADVRHRNLVELHELCVTDESCFFTMELVDGDDFVTFVQRLRPEGGSWRDASAAQLALLDDVVAQIVRAVRAIHDAGKLHRDIKPSNVLVTDDGRVVVLDFGLGLPIERAADANEWQTLVGTPMYMAPEQMFGESLSPKSDWYALGVMLFESLTGSSPFGGSYGEVLAGKRRGARDARSVDPAVPEHLATLVTSLLDPDPERRPDGPRLLELLESPGGRAATFFDESLLGRDDELALLRECFEAARSQSTVAHVKGESGIGKSTLLQNFVAHVARRDDALVLRGRCHPRESVPYKALDGVIDQLTAELLRDRSFADRVLPERSPWLERLFPVLRRLHPDGAAIVDETVLDPVEARRAGAEALATMLRAVAAIQPLVLWIDDLQWGDADSAAVLRAILSAPSPPPMLVLLSYRSEDVAGSAMLRAIAERPLEGRSVHVRSLSLAPLAPQQAAELARLMLPDDPSQEAAVEVARDSGGSPFFIRELARHRRFAAPTEGGQPRLEEILAWRLGALPADARLVLELVSLAATTLTTHDAVDASGAGGAAWSVVRMLESEGLVRLAPLGSEQGVEPYHDRVRESVVASIAAAALVERHRTLAEVLELSPRRDPEALLAHHLGAGNTPAALHNARLAAARAASTLAFDRAASHYRTALGLLTDPAERLPLVVDLAEALNSAGRTGEAADCFLEAARLAESRRAGALDLRRLRRRASECLLRSGRSTEGRALMWDILRSVDAPLPRSERDALLRATLARLPLLVGPLPKPRAHPKALGPAGRERLDVLWAAAICLSWEPITAGYFRARYIREALPTNEPLLVAAALGAEAASQGAMRWAFLRRRGDRLLARMEEMVRTLDDPYTTAHAASVRASNAFFRGRWREALASGDLEVELLRRHCHGVSWELAVAHIFSLLALSFLGEMRTLRLRLDEALLDATERGDQFAVGNLRLGQHNFCKLATDEADEALAQAERVAHGMPADRFDVQHYHRIVLVTQCHLYRGDPLAAWREIDGAWARIKAAQFLQLAFTSIELVHLRARAALALAADPVSGRAAQLGIPTRPELLRVAGRASRSIGRSDAPPAAAFAASLDAALARARGDHEQHARHLRWAAAGYERADMRLHAAAARWCGARGDGQSNAAARAALEAAVVRPEAVAATLLPGAMA